MAPDDPDTAFVLNHVRFVGLRPSDGHYTIRIVDRAGHEIEITAPLGSVFRLAAEALRRTER